jgi:hypothetical protein
MPEPVPRRARRVAAIALRDLGYFFEKRFWTQGFNSPGEVPGPCFPPNQTLPLSVTTSLPSPLDGTVSLPSARTDVPVPDNRTPAWCTRG